MNEIYWITRFDPLHTLGIIFTWASLVIFVVCWLISVTTDDWTGEDCCTTKQKQQLRRGANYSIAPFILGILLWVFVPTKKEALLIYGVGGTIDYVKTNPTAKQLPDKCIKALDGWVDSWNIEKNDSTKKK